MIKEEKIALFQGIFRGREDVFARYWESRRTGRKGYSPACRNEWKEGVCFKPCSNCRNKDYIPLDESWIEKHLYGREVLGIYPLLPDGTTYFVVIDLDGNHWMEEGRRFYEVCRNHNIPSYIERSRSGKGGHIWIFFEANINAAKARRFAFVLLKEANLLDERISFDRILPNQDYLKERGLGNLIALPLQKSAREQDNTVFLNPADKFYPYKDQWNLLYHIESISEDKIDRVLVREEIGSQRKASLKHTLIVSISNKIEIPISSVNQGLYKFLKESLTFHNPIFYDRKRKGFSTWKIPRIINCLETEGEWFILPRGFMVPLSDFCKEKGISIQINDHTISAGRKALKFNANLYEYQKRCVQRILESDIGILEAPAGSGKTLIALKVVACRKQRTLIAVHTKELLLQWKQRMSEVLALEPQEIGTIGANKFQLGKKITVALYQTLAKRNLREIIPKIGLLVVDECHHVPANMFRKVVSQFQAKFLLGLTATPKRKDGLHKLMFFYMGPIISRLTQDELAAENQKLVIKLLIRKTNFYPRLESLRSIHSLANELIDDEGRNRRIVSDIIAEVLDGRTCLVLSERKKHCERIASGLKEKVKFKVLSGKSNISERKEAIKELKKNKIKVLIATGQLLGEGFDCKEINSLFLTFPFSSKAKLSQYIGRTLRRKPGKGIVWIYDYYDQYVVFCHLLYERRMKVYKKFPSPITIEW